MRPSLAAAAAAAALAAAAPAAARTIPSTHQVVAYVPTRIDAQIGFVPVAGMSPGGAPKAESIPAGGDVYRGIWNNVTVGRATTSEALRYMWRDAQGRYGQRDHLLFADRDLTRRERRRFKVLVDLGRDADVLAVRAGHPACAGLTEREVRGIAAGRIRRWSAVLDGAPGGPDAIALRHASTSSTAHEPRFGVGRLPKGARGRTDGGLAEAARSGAVAAVTSWSRARGRPGVCTVPIGGVAPSDEAVRARSYPGAYPVALVAVRKRQQHAYGRAVRARYLRFVRSPRAAELFGNLGLLMAPRR